MKKNALSPELREQLRRSLTTGADVALDADSMTLEALDASGTATPIGRAERREMLQRLRAGEALELHAEVTGFIQRDTPNRNFVRFKPGILPALSTSFRGVPFLRDHASRDLAARGGKVVDTRFEHREDGSKAIRFRLHLVKAWAVEGFLDGTIDRFSIGWSRTGPVLCSLDERPLFGPGCCDHWPGDQVDGRVCEVLYTGAEGTEISAVNVPAVVGTGIDGVRQLAAALGEFDGAAVLADILGADLTQETTVDLTALLTALGLQAGATVDQAAERARAIAAELAAANTDRELLRARLGQTELAVTRLTGELTAAQEAGRKTAVDTGIGRLYAARKLQVVVGGENPVEKHLRELGVRDLELFHARCAEILAGPDVSPTGAPPPSPPPSGGEAKGSELSEQARRWMKKAGLSQKDIDAHGKRHLDRLADLDIG